MFKHIELVFSLDRLDKSLSNWNFNKDNKNQSFNCY